MPRSRPTKLTPALHAAIVNAVAAGVPLSTAAALAGCAYNTVQEWVKRGIGLDPERPPRPVYTTFAHAIFKAHAQDEARRVARIEQAGRGGAVIWQKTTTYADGRTVTEQRTQPPDWNADAWHLERSRAAQWGRKERMDVSLHIQEMVAKVAAEAGLTVEDVLAEAQALLKAMDHARLP